MKYIILLYGNQEAWNTLTESAVDELASAHTTLQRDLRMSGEFVESSEIDENTAAVIRSEEGVVTESKGPLIEGRFIVSGYYIVDCADMSRAKEIARRFAEVKFAPVEVRRLGDGSTWTELQDQR